MITVELKPWSEPLAGAVPDALQGTSWLWHQVETFRLLEHEALVVNTSATGTGKTTAAHTHLLRHPAMTLIVAPTNALVAQHAADAEAFVKRRGLPHQVHTADAAALVAFRRRNPEAAGFDQGRTLLSMLTGRFGEVDPGRPRVVVTNPDIFVRAVGFDYGSQSRNLALAVLGALDYLVIDEVHYYDGIQLSALFFALALWGTGIGLRPSRRVLLLTATPDGDLRDALDGLTEVGLSPARVDPSQAPVDLPRTVSLAPITLRLEPESDPAAQTVNPSWAEEAVDAVNNGEDAAILLDRLDQVTELYLTLAPRLGERVRRITGPTPANARVTATGAPLVLATPTVDIGFNFVGRSGKTRQALDRVWFGAPTLDRFWQRLGRAGRVLGRSVQDVPSTATAAIPAEVLARLEVPDGPISRAELAERLIRAADGVMDRPRLGDATAPASADLLSYMWAGIANATSDTDRLRPYFERLPHPAEWTFERALARGRGLRELDSIRRDEKPLLDPYHRFGWLPWLRDPAEQAACARLPEIAKNPHHRSREKAREQLRRAAVCAGACLDAARAFRGEGVMDGDVWAWDNQGFYLDTPGWTALSLERLIKRHEFVVLSPHEAGSRGAPGAGAAVQLTAQLGRGRRASLVLDNTDAKTLDDRRGRVYGWDEVSLHVERDGGIQLFDDTITRLLLETFRRDGVALFFPFRAGAARMIGRRFGLWPWTVWLGAPNRGEAREAWAGSAAIRMEALLNTTRRERTCPED